MGKRNFLRYHFVLFCFVPCSTVFCDISYEISCLMHNSIFMWARELTRSRTRYLGFCEILYKISFGILRHFVRDIV